MILRELSEREISRLKKQARSRPWGVEGFLLHLGGMSIDDAFDKLREERERLNLDFQTQLQ